MVSPVSSITRAATRKIHEPLNVLTFPTHERYESMMAKCGHNFYAYRAEGIKDWNTTYAPVPENYFLLDPELGESQIPDHVDFDVILSQNKFGQYQIAKKMAGLLHVPIISLEHTLPVPNWSPSVLESTRHMRGHLNLFISRYSIDAWGWEEGKDTLVITHGVDTELFKPNESVEREDHALSVVNDWINRDWCCGFKIWQDVIQGLPHRVMGDTPGLSEPASSTQDLVSAYQSSRIFLNTSTISPIPTVLLEAMSCGCAVVSTETCMIPEVIEHGVNGFISNDINELKQYVVDLLNDKDLARQMGEAARETVVKSFSVDKFASKWDFILHSASKKVFLG